MPETTTIQQNRQGRIAGWLKQHGATVSALAAHCGLSAGTMSAHCNSVTVPVAVLERMKSFTTPDGYFIPASYLPEGVDRKPGPRPGWIEERIRVATEQA